MNKPFVLSVEGPGYIDRDTWSTHKILGVFSTEEEARQAHKPGDEEVVLLTDLNTGDVERIF